MELEWEWEWETLDGLDTIIPCIVIGFMGRKSHGGRPFPRCNAVRRVLFGP